MAFDHLLLPCNLTKRFVGLTDFTVVVNCVLLLEGSMLFCCSSISIILLVLSMFTSSLNLRSYTSLLMSEGGANGAFYDKPLS